MNINDKKEVVKQTREKFESSQAFFITHNLGLTAAEVTALRKEIRTSGGELKVIKNTLVRRAIGDLSYHKDIDADLNGPVAVAFSYQDPAAVAKAVLKYVDDRKKFEIISGIYGSKKMSAKEIVALSKLPGRKELLTQTVRTIAAPLQNFMGVMSAVPRDFLNVLTAIKGKKE
ncbi:MAG: 50S ribosomal protein L10 [Pseudomonadota bacterium]